MKKLLYLPLLVSGGASEQYDLETALRKVYDVKVLDHIAHPYADNELINIVNEWRPDYVHIQASGRIRPETVRNLKMLYPDIVFTQWTGDTRKELIPLIVEFGKVVDATLLASGKGQRELYEQIIEKPVFWWQHAVADWQFRPTGVERTGTVMIANIYPNFPGSEERVSLALTLTEAFDDFTTYGNGWPEGINQSGSVLWKETPNVYSRFRFAIGPNAYEDIEWYFSDRPLMAMAGGCCFLMRRSPNIERLFASHEVLYYDTPEEAIELINATSSQRAYEIARMGQEKVRQFHTWDYRVREYQEIVANL